MQRLDQAQYLAHFQPWRAVFWVSWESLAREGAAAPLLREFHGYGRHQVDHSEQGLAGGYLLAADEFSTGYTDAFSTGCSTRLGKENCLKIDSRAKLALVQEITIPSRQKQSINFVLI